MLLFLLGLRLFDFPLQKNTIANTLTGNWIANISNTTSLLLSSNKDQTISSIYANITQDTEKNTNCFNKSKENKFYKIQISSEKFQNQTLFEFNFYSDNPNQIHFGISNECNFSNETLIEFQSQNKSPFFASGNYFDYVYHILIKSKNRISVTLFEPNTSVSQPSFTGKIYQIEFVKDISRSPATIFQKYFPFILLLLIYIFAYIYGFWKQTKKLQTSKEKMKKDGNKQQRSDLNSTQNISKKQG